MGEKHIQLTLTVNPVSINQGINVHQIEKI